MALVLSSSGLTEFLGNIFSSGTLTVCLYQSNTTPTVSSTAGSFTESTFSGYSRKTIAYSDWSSPTMVSGVAVVAAPDLSWTSTSSQSCYGYYVLDSGGTLLWAELFPSAQTLTNGSVITVTPQFTFANS